MRAERITVGCIMKIQWPSTGRDCSRICKIQCGIEVYGRWQNATAEQLEGALTATPSPGANDLSPQGKRADFSKFFDLHRCSTTHVHAHKHMHMCSQAHMNAWICISISK